MRVCEWEKKHRLHLARVFWYDLWATLLQHQRHSLLTSVPVLSRDSSPRAFSQGSSHLPEVPVPYLLLVCHLSRSPCYHSRFLPSLSCRPHFVAPVPLVLVLKVVTWPHFTSTPERHRVTANHTAIWISVPCPVGFPKIVHDTVEFATDSWNEWEVALSLWETLFAGFGSL